MGISLIVVFATVQCSSPRSDEDADDVLREQRAEITAAAREVRDLMTDLGGQIEFTGAPDFCGGSPPSYGAQFVAGATWTDGPGTQNDRIDRVARGVLSFGWKVASSTANGSGGRDWRLSRGDLILSLGKSALRGSDDVAVGLGAPCIRVSKEYANAKIPPERKPLAP